MPRSVDLYLSDLLEASSDILRFTNGVDFAAYKSNRLLRAAAERLFTIIGEAMRQLEQHHPQSSAIFAWHIGSPKDHRLSQRRRPRICDRR